MKQTSPRVVKFAMQDIHEKYEILLERGYEIVFVEGIPAGWQALLRKSGLEVKLFRARGEDDVLFRTEALPPDEFFDIGSVVYAATGERIPLKSYDDLSGEVRKYIAAIESYFQSEPVNLRDSLKAAQEQYHAELSASVGMVYPEGASETAPPKEPKRIAILYYPLMAVVLLLLLGALTTLYAVLLDRLVSSFSTEADFYTPYLAVGAVLLAVLTLLFLRRWVKWS